jgi:hypothetical protein
MPDSAKLIVSKIEAAQRQLNTAIELWFHDGDEVSVHTLAAAAYQIIHDIKIHRKIDRDLLYDARLVRDEYRGEWIAAMKRAQNFFKHADRDPEPEGTVDLHPFGNLVFLMVSAAGLQLLGIKGSYQVGALMLWLTIHEPRFLNPDYRKQFEERARADGIDDFEDVRAVPKAQFFEHYMRTSRANEANGR